MQINVLKNLVKNLTEVATQQTNKLVCWLVMFNGPSTARSLRDGTPIYCPLQRMWSSVFTTLPPGIEPLAVVW